MENPEELGVEHGRGLRHTTKGKAMGKAIAIAFIVVLFVVFFKLVDKGINSYNHCHVDKGIPCNNN